MERRSPWIFSQVEETPTVTTARTLAAVSAATLLSLTGCSGGTSVYDFTEPAADPNASIEFRVPDELVEMSDDYAQSRVYETITISSVAAEDPSQCTVEYQFEYVDGGLDRLLEFVDETSAQNSGTEEERIAGLLTGEPSSSELSEDYSSAVAGVPCATSPTEAENTVRAAFLQLVDGEVDSFARAEVTVMQGGELFVHAPEVRDWQRDTNGNWVSQEG
jgi:hypothetical protein